jgi:hypothetical protein
MERGGLARLEKQIKLQKITHHSLADDMNVPVTFLALGNIFRGGIDARLPYLFQRPGIL